ncbi:MAG: TolC family protein [Pseudomonadota bacterium]
MRFALSLFLLALPMAVCAQASQPPLGEAEAVRLGLSQSGLVDLERGAILAAEAEALAAGQIPNPILSYARDKTHGSPGSVEQNLMLSQTLDLSGRRALRREAAERRVDLAGAENASRRAEVAAEIRRAFHEALFRQEAVRATVDWVRHFSRVEQLVDKLARAGEASGYDRRRLARERQDSEVRLAGERAELGRALARLAALTGLAGDPAVSGELLPAAPPPIESALTGLDRRPDLLALAHRAEAADLDGRAASPARIPEVTVGIGPRWVDNGIAKDSGFAASLSVPLPVFDRQQAARQRAAAEAMQARATYQLARARAEGDLRGLHRQASALRGAALDYRARAVAATPELLRIAEAAYQGGESSLLELLDAYRGALEAETAALELEKRARDVRIEYDLLTGSVTE